MIYNPLFYSMIFPNFPTGNDKPPTLYSIMNSMVNFEAETPTKIKDLASASRSQIFNFSYPLSNNVSRETFEIMILNKFMMRRIGFETFTAFQIQLNVKLNEIMPMYNKLFDAIEGWNLFQDGENVNRVVTDNRTINQTTDVTGSIDNTNNSTNTLTNNSTTNENEDLRHSDTPQNQLENVKNGSYVTDYSYNTRSGSDESTSNGTSTSTNNQTSTNKTQNDTTDKNNINETINRTPGDKINLYKQFLESKQNIYSMIFKDLDSLFYQLI